MPRTPIHLWQPLRAVWRRPGWSAAVVLVLALGSGVAGAVGAVAWGTLARPLPYRDGGALVALFTVERQGSEPRNPTSPADFLDWRAGLRTVRQVTAARPKTFALTGHGAARELPALAATPELFALLGVEPALGRTFGAADAADPRVVVLAADYWRRELGADRDVVGRVLQLDGEPYTVAGVMPDGFRFPPFWSTGAQAWVPLVFTPEQAATRETRYLRVFGRLAPGATVQTARAELAALSAEMARRAPDGFLVGSNLESLREPTVAAVRPALLLLLAGAALLLLVASASAVNLLLARVLERRAEATLRAALGATRGRLVAESLAESLTLALLGGAAGNLLARVLVRVLSARFGGFLPPVARLDADLVSTAFPFAAALLAAAVGVAATATFGASGWESLRSGGRTTGGGSGARRVLVGLQVALAVVLLGGAAGTAQTVWTLLHRPPGFTAEGVLAVDLSLAASPAGVGTASQERLFSALVEQVSALPGVSSAAVVNHLPLRGDFWRLPLEVRQPLPANEAPVASLRVVTADYFATLGIPLIAGHGLAGAEAGGEPVAVVNEALVRERFAGRPVLGERLRLGGDDEPWRRIVGVVGDVRQTGLVDPVVAEVYLPYAQNPVSWHTGATLVVRQHLGRQPAGASVFAAVTDRLRRLDPAVPLARPQSLGEVLRDEVAAQRLQLALLGAFAAAALLLATIGLHGMARVFVAARTRELGVRQALGAGRRQVVALVLAEGARVSLPAVVVGAALALPAGRLSTSPPGLGGGPLLVLLAALAVTLVALAAVGWQARRASRISPLAALHGEGE